VAVVVGAAATRRVRAQPLLLGLMLVISVASASPPRLGGQTIETFGLFLLLAVVTTTLVP
jgi:hypothetical protein